MPRPPSKDVKEIPKDEDGNPIPSVRANQLLRGFKDILPSDQPYWDFMRQRVDKLATTYGFQRIDTPILEETSLYNRSLGKQTDIVQKEMFTFSDQGGSSLVLRPEPTAAMMRAYINHGMISLTQPVKLYTIGPIFRRERPQAGRTRQFHQFDFEVIGDGGPVVDAQLISMLYNFFVKLGLTKVRIAINSIGNLASRQAYKEELVSYYKGKRRLLCADCKKRLTKNPLRLLDCKEAGCQPVKEEAPQIIDWLDEQSRTHFMKVIEFLDELDMPYELNPYLVRGLDYYTHTVWEVLPDEGEQGSQSSLAGGGRYDGLAEVLGGEPTSACGFGVGIERTIAQLKLVGAKVPKGEQPDLFLAQIGDQAKVKALKLFEKMRQANLKVSENFAKDSLKSQLEQANKLGVKYVIVLGQKEVVDGTALIRDMESGIQEVVDYDKTIDTVKKKLSQADSAES